MKTRLYVPDPLIKILFLPTLITILILVLTGGVKWKEDRRVQRLMLDSISPVICEQCRSGSIWAYRDWRIIESYTKKVLH